MRGLLDAAVGRDQVAAYGELRGNRDFRRWFWSSLYSSFGDWVGIFALQVLVISLADPGSRLALFGLGAIMMARLLPSVLLGPLAGVAGDRFDRKRLMITMDVARAGLFVGVAFSRDLVQLLVLVLVIETCSLAYLAAKSASLPDIVEEHQLVQANQVTLLITYGPLPFGAAAAGLISVLAGLLDRVGLGQLDPTTAALLLNAATFGLGALLLTRLSLRRRTGHDSDDGEDSPGAVAQLVEGLRFVRDHQIVRALIIGVVAVFFGAGAVIALGPEFVRSELGRSGQAWYGLMTTVGFGLLAGMAATPGLTARFRIEPLLAVALVLAGGGTIVAGLVPSYLWVQVMGALLGITAGIAFVAGYTMLQQRPAAEMRGRTFAAFFTGTRISLFAALALAPFTAALIAERQVGVGAVEVTISGMRVVIVLGGVVALAGAVVCAYGLVQGLRDET